MDGPCFDVFSRQCPSRSVLEHATGRWGALTLGALYEGGCRFNELRRRVDGVSEKMLSQTLRALERDGLVRRDAWPVNPPRVDYELTPLGREIAGRLSGLMRLVEERMPEVLMARGRYDTPSEPGGTPAGPQGAGPQGAGLRETGPRKAALQKAEPQDTEHRNTRR